MISFDPKKLSTPKLHGYLLGSVSPRPICFASTINANGLVNLSPYSFFNVFSANPPVMIFSPARRVRDNTTKHTLENVLETREVVINIVSHAMVQQMSLSSTEYPKGVNEFTKAGFTEIPSEIVRPPRVKESPVQFECGVTRVVPLGEEGGAGNLVICEVLKLHINESILDENGHIDPARIDTVARMGGNWYSRARDGMFEVAKPLKTIGIGVDSLPEEIRKSTVLTGNDLGILGNQESMPSSETILAYRNKRDKATAYLLSDAELEAVHTSARELISDGKIEEALTLLIARAENKTEKA